jgi:hypothetical protein
MLDREFTYYKQHQKEFAERFHGKFLLIHGEEVIGAYDNELAAYTDAKKRQFANGSFLIQQCLSAQEEPTQVFHSRVTI